MLCGYAFWDAHFSHRSNAKAIQISWHDYVSYSMHRESAISSNYTSLWLVIVSPIYVLFVSLFPVKWNYDTPIVLFPPPAMFQRHIISIVGENFQRKVSWKISEISWKIFSQFSRLDFFLPASWAVMIFWYLYPCLEKWHILLLI